MVRVKICGITSLRDALDAVACGADALGFVFYERSPRRIAPEEAAAIIAALPPLVSKVGVFVDSGLAEITDIVSFCKLDLVQLHGEESPELCEALFPRVIKAFRVAGSGGLADIGKYRASAYLLDTYVPDAVGGTGQTFDWEGARAISAAYRVILAGGLTPGNVQQAIQVVNPYGVDVSTGVEASPGRKDIALMRAFISAAKGARYGVYRMPIS